MKAKDKQVLIEYCERVLHGSNNNSPMEAVYKIALAALTAQPVKCPTFGDYKAHIAEELRAAFTLAVRDAGYEVEE